jgi:hypothetical protein
MDLALLIFYIMPWYASQAQFQIIELIEAGYKREFTAIKAHSHFNSTSKVREKKQMLPTADRFFSFENASVLQPARR